MKKKKIITITTKLFQLKIFWNGMYVSLQIGVLIGLLAIRLFSQQETVHRFCLLALIIDILAIFIGSLSRASIKSEDGVLLNTSTQTSDYQEKETMDVEVKHMKSAEKSNTKSKTVTTSNAVIHNKVGAPVTTPESAKEEINSEPQKTEEKSMKPVEEFTEEDWENLFNGDM
jgi:uncharacterized membrane protein YraQ (UPF0718 family)